MAEQPIDTAPRDGSAIWASHCQWASLGLTIKWLNGSWCADFGKEGWIPVRGPFKFWWPALHNADTSGERG